MAESDSAGIRLAESEGEGGTELVDVVELLPGEELHLAGEGLAGGVAESLGDRAGGAAYMAVGGGLQVDGGAELLTSSMRTPKIIRE